MKRAQTMDGVATFIGPVDLKRFAVAAGQMWYSRLKQSRMNVWRQQYLVDAFCEIPICGATGDASALVFDHCHRHGWARAVLCYRHNAQLGHLEAAWLEYGLDLSGTPYGRILAGCLDCMTGAPADVFPRDRARPKREQLAKNLPEAGQRRIQTDLQRRIDVGEWPAGSRLPTQADLAEQYGVRSVQPVKTALSRLEALGVVILRRGGSAIVAPRPSEEQ